MNTIRVFFGLIIIDYKDLPESNVAITHKAFIIYLIILLVLAAPRPESQIFTRRKLRTVTGGSVVGEKSQKAKDAIVRVAPEAS